MRSELPTFTLWIKDDTLIFVERKYKMNTSIVRAESAGEHPQIQNGWTTRLDRGGWVMTSVSPCFGTTPSSHDALPAKQ
ncbi:MAG: hypothetical protein JO356_10455 [Acidobacteria bacterium]|nr:hypothetical protein [Acidobacteriota bacterium]